MTEVDSLDFHFQNLTEETQRVVQATMLDDEKPAWVLRHRAVDQANKLCLLITAFISLVGLATSAMVVVVLEGSFVAYALFVIISLPVGIIWIVKFFRFRASTIYILTNWRVMKVNYNGFKSVVVKSMPYKMIADGVTVFDSRGTILWDPTQNIAPEGDGPEQASISMLIPAPELYMDFVNVPKPIEVAKFIVAQVARSPLRFTATSTSTDLTIDLSTQSRDGLGIASASHLPAHKRNALQSFMSAHPDEKVQFVHQSTMWQTMRKLTIPLGICAIALALYVGLSYIVPELKPGLAAPIIIIAFIGAVGTVTMAFLTRSLGRKAEVITTKSLLAFRRGLWVAPCSCGGSKLFDRSVGDVTSFPLVSKFSIISNYGSLRVPPTESETSVTIEHLHNVKSIEAMIYRMYYGSLAPKSPTVIRKNMYMDSYV